MTYHYPPGTNATTCSLDGCKRLRWGRHKLCSTHTSRKYAGRPLRPTVPSGLIPEATRESRFWAKVDTAGGIDACWPWSGNRIAKGYGIFTHRGRNAGAHRTAYQYAVGQIPDGLWVLHRCDNPPCCNPAHLWLGTATDNNRDMIAKGRAGWQREAV